MDYSSQHGLSRFTGRKMMIILCVLLLWGNVPTHSVLAEGENVPRIQSTTEAPKADIKKREEPEAQRRDHSFNPDGTVNYHGSGSGHDSGDLVPPPGGSVFNSPSIELSVGHTGASGPGLSNSYGLPVPDDTYGPPKNFHQPSQQYGPPNKYPPPPKPVYGPPKPSYRPPSPPKPVYGAPSAVQFRPPKTSYASVKPIRPKPFSSRPKPVYGPPKEGFGFSHATLLSPVSSIKTQYGPPKISATYGTPLQPSTAYGVPKHTKHGHSSIPPTPPVVKYDGWKPIPGLVSSGPSGAYGAPDSTGPGIDFSSSAHSGSGFDSIAPPSGSYGPPSFGGSSFGSSGFGAPSGSYGPPPKPSISYGTPLKPSSSYGPPIHKGSSKPNFFGSLKPPSSSYGLPDLSIAPPSGSYGPPKPPSISYGVPQISSSYGPPRPPSSSYGPPKAPSSSYGPPKAPSISYGPPRAPSSSYGPPRAPSSSYGPPRLPSISYGPPKSPSSSYGPPKAPSSSYGPPKAPSSSYGPPKAPSSSYGPPSSFGSFAPPTSISGSFIPPKIPSSAYGPPKAPSSSYGPPTAPSSSYGPPTAPSSSYGPPKAPSISYGPPRAPSSSYGPPKAPSSSYGPPKAPSSSYGPPQIFTSYSIPKPGISITATPSTAYRGPAVSHPLQPPSTYGPPSFQEGLYKTPLPPNALYGVPTAPALATGCCGPTDASWQFQSSTYGAPLPDLHAPALQSLQSLPAVELNTQFLSTGPSPIFSSAIPSTSYGTPLLASTPATVHHAPASTYGVPTALPLRQPKNPVKFRPPVPPGLISSIAAKWGDSGAWGGSSHSHSNNFHGNTYIPPAVPDPDPGTHANKGNALIIPPPPAPPINYGPPPSSQASQFGSTSHPSVDDGLYPPPPSPAPAPLHGSGFNIQQSASVELPSSNNLDHQVGLSDNRNQFSSIAYNAPVETTIQNHPTSPSVSQDITGGVHNIPIKGTQGSYTLQIQPAGGNSGEHVPHNEVLSNGLLQDILAAIENPNGSPKLEQYGGQQSNDPVASEIGLGILKQLGGTQAQQSNSIQLPTQYGSDLSHSSSRNVPLYTTNSDTGNEIVQIPSTAANKTTDGDSNVKIGKYLSQNKIAFYYNNQEGIEDRQGDVKDVLLVQMLLPNNSTNSETEKSEFGALVSIKLQNAQNATVTREGEGS